MTPPPDGSPGGLEAALAALRDFDHRAVARLAALDSTGRLRPLMLGATRAADGWALAAIIPAALLLGGARGFAAVLLGILSCSFLALVIHATKTSIRRSRPVGLPIERPIGAPDKHAFPSGHTGQAFGMVVLGWWASPVLGLALLPVAVLVALSRMFFGLHYPSDCVVGAVMGCLITVAVLAVAEASGLVDFLTRLSPLG